MSIPCRWAAAGGACVSGSRGWLRVCAAVGLSWRLGPAWCAARVCSRLLLAGPVPPWSCLGPPAARERQGGATGPFPRRRRSRERALSHRFRDLTFAGSPTGGAQEKVPGHLPPASGGRPASLSGMRPRERWQLLFGLVGALGRGLVGGRPAWAMVPSRFRAGPAVFRVPLRFSHCSSGQRELLAS